MKKQSATKTFFKIFGILLLTILIISVVYISIFLSTPLKMKEYTLTNGQQTIVFQEMVHIGETDFYKQVEENLKHYRLDGYIYAYEQVRISNMEEAKELTELTGLGIDTYGIISEQLGLDNQKNHMGHITENDINADMSAGDLIVLMKNYKNENPHVEEMSVDIEDSLKSLKEAGSMTKSIVKGTMRGMLKIASKGEVNMGEGLLQDVILKERDQKMFDIISNIEANKIVVHYGALHFKGFFERLKKADSNWKIVNEKEIKAF